jgi:hypothetical protein
MNNHASQYAKLWYKNHEPTLAIPQFEHTEDSRTLIVIRSGQSRRERIFNHKKRVIVQISPNHR